MSNLQIIRMNPKLTTNIKLVFDSKDNIYFESIKSNTILSDSRFNLKVVDKSTTYGTSLVKFWSGVPSDIVYSIKDDNDVDVVYRDFNSQIDDTYLTGVKYNTLNSNEMYEYETTLFIDGVVPDIFGIFRIDGLGLVDISDTFNDEYLAKMKLIKMYKLTDGDLGAFFRNSFNNDDIPRSSIDVSFKSNDFLKWKGIDLYSGQYISKSRFIYDKVRMDNTFYDIDKMLIDGFRDNGIVHPRLVNISYLYDDYIGVDGSLSHYSVNRYSGYYGYKNNSCIINSYNNIQLIDNINIDFENCFYDIETKEYVIPFKNYRNDMNYFIEYNGLFYQVVVDGVRSKIISDINLGDKISSINKRNVSFIDNYVYGLEHIIDYDVFTTKDVWVIDIKNDSYSLKYDLEKQLYYIDSDFIINSVSDGVNIKLSDVDRSFKYGIYTTYNRPLTYNIYSIDFIEVADFNYNFIDSEYTDYEYELIDNITDTDEPKTYYNDDNGQPSSYLYMNSLVNIPCGSEYTSNGEIFQLSRDGISGLDKLNDLWKKNQYIAKFGYIKSISGNDMPYRFNLSTKFDFFNRTTDIYYNDVSRVNRNLDYFYTVGLSNSNMYKNFSLNIISSPYDLEEYIKSNYDYMEDFFNKKVEYVDGKRINKKCSKMLKGDSVITNHTLFRGIKYSIYKVNNTVDETINVGSTNDFEDWNFSVLCGKLNKDIFDNYRVIDNRMLWKVINRWSIGRVYDIGDMVLFDGEKFSENDNVEEVFVCINNVGEWGRVPSNSVNFTRLNISYYNDNNSKNPLTTFYNRNVKYNGGAVVLYRDEYYVCISETSINNATQNPTNDTYWSKVPAFSLKTDYEYYVSDGSVYKGAELILTTNYNVNSLYGVNGNNEVIKIDDLYYTIISNPNNDYLDSGVNVFFNYDRKNILIYIYINDNTTYAIDNIMRDDMYNIMNRRLIANNLMRYINNINELCGFSNTINYIEIRNGLVNMYNRNNINEIKYVVKCDEPTIFGVNDNTLKISYFNDSNVVINKVIKGKEITSYADINNYDINASTYVRIESSENLIARSINYTRYDGFYDVIFKKINIFSPLNKGRFDIDYMDFGNTGEFIISKVSNNIKLTTGKYPIYNDIGYSVVKRSIYMSNYDKKYYLLYK